MEILISTPTSGQYFRYRIEFQGFWLWHSQNFYHKRLEALNAAFLDTWGVLIEFNFFSPTALFDLKSGVVLAVNHTHRCQLAHGVGRHYSEVVGDRQLTSQIIPVGTQTLGLYEIPLIEASTKDLSRQGADFCSHQIQQMN